MMTSGSPSGKIEQNFVQSSTEQQKNLQTYPSSTKSTFSTIPTTSSVSVNSSISSIDQLKNSVPTDVFLQNKIDFTDPIAINSSTVSKNTQFTSSSLLSLLERNHFSLPNTSNYEDDFTRQFGGLDLNQSRRNSDGSFDIHQKKQDPVPRNAMNLNDSHLMHARSFDLDSSIKQHQPMYSNSTEHLMFPSSSSSPYRVATSTALRALASPNSIGMEHDFLDDFEAENFDTELGGIPANTLSQNAHLLHNLGNLPPDSMYFKGYSATPPPGYVCKLCFVDGHWLRNCQLYLERKRGNQLHQQFMAELSNNPASNLISDQLKYQYQKLSQQLYLGGTRLPLKTTPPDGYICRKCNTPGHWIQQCPFQKTSIPPTTYTCRICGVKGHWIYQCAHRLPKQVSNGVGLLGLGSLGSNLVNGLGANLQTNLGGNHLGKECNLNENNGTPLKMADFFY
ncbi:hypothetical protein HK099_002722, partial [Clydaea vesicula]